jgi:hypothetical protein
VLRARPFLSFRWQSKILQWTRLPFGLSTAPALFTRIIKKALSPLRKAGVPYVQYLDDILIVGASKSECSENADKVFTQLVNMGFRIGLKKSVLTPTQQITFLGFQLDTVRNQLSIPPEKIRKIRREAQKLLLAGQSSARKFASVLGLLNSVAAALPQGILQTRWLQRCLARGMRASASWATTIVLTTSAASELAWWIKTMPTWNGVPLPLTQRLSALTVTTDASETGWGVVTPWKVYYGEWTAKQAMNSSNWRELWAATTAIRLVAPRMAGCHITLQSDNSTTIAVLNRQGTTCSADLLRLAKLAWQTALQHRLTFQAVYIPGTENIAADRASRRAERHDYQLSDKAFAMVQASAPGELRYDLFASRTSAKLPRFYTRQDDALTKRWPKAGGYAFPPPRLIGPTLQRMMQCRVRWMLLVTPAWGSLPTLPILQQLQIAPTRWLPPAAVEREPDSQHRRHPTANGLWIWTLSGRRCNTTSARGLS